MEEKRIPLVNEELKHKKKSISKGQPRSKHKHIYETVLLASNYRSVNLKTGAPEIHKYLAPTKVCTICGRIDKVDNDESYYITKQPSLLPFLISNKALSEKAWSLPKWYAEDFWDKFAVKEESEEL